MWTTNSKHTLPVADNVLDRQFEVAKPNRAWASDITYIRTAQGWLYLAAVLDLHSRKVVGWSMAPNMSAQLVISALMMALQQRRPPPGLIVHSDRGSQYASAEYQPVLARHRIVCSMSRKGNCWDNSVMERFLLNLKMERGLPASVRQPRRGTQRHQPVHRRLLQQPAAAFNIGLSVAHRLRGEIDGTRNYLPVRN